MDGGGAMEADPFHNAKEDEHMDAQTFKAGKMKMIQPDSLKDPKLDKLKEQVLLGWINESLKAEHIVVQSVEEDLYDGLVLHHLLARFAGVHLTLEEMALTASAQIRKLEAVLEELDKRLEQQDTKWEVSLIHKKDLLATLHLLVAMVTRFQPEVELPSNVKVQVVVLEVSRTGIQSDVQTEVLTEDRGDNAQEVSDTTDDPMEQLMEMEVKQTMAGVGLQVSDLDQQFSDGVILLLLIGQLEGFFIPLSDFRLTPDSHEHRLHNVSLALSLLADLGLQVSAVQAQDVVSQDVAGTLKVLYALFRKHGG
ncbi:gamma-parvin-like isoform X11 [Nerophis ophidion]|uniref:gamma-parvin-like isoform X11 n=1 Tax=Nerophis ophidion TaxID=159077 RepID=UPI002ADFC4C9|nr:gamma-parvin-like isoform X11 [Nerophis ophidion]